MTVPDHHEPALFDRIRGWGTVAWSLIGILILVGVALWTLRQVQEALLPLVLALVTVFILNPVVSKMERVGISRLPGSCLSYTVFIAAVAVALSFLVPMLVKQGQGFVQDFPRTWNRVGVVAEQFSGEMAERFGVELDIGTWLQGRTDLAEQALERTRGFLTGAVHAVTLFVIGIVLGFYLLIDLPRLRGSALRLISPARRPETVEVSAAVGRAMGGFFRGQLLVALIVGVLSALALRIIGLPYWAVVGMIAGFFNLIPLIGPFVGAIPGIVIAAAFMSPINMLWVAIALTIVQQIDNHLISPNVMRWTVRLHPVTVMLSLIVGATLAGFWGMLLAVPVVASGKVIAGHFWRTRVPWGNEVFDAEVEDLDAALPPGAGGERDDRTGHVDGPEPPDGSVPVFGGEPTGH